MSWNNLNNPSAMGFLPGVPADPEPPGAPAADETAAAETAAPAAKKKTAKRSGKGASRAKSGRPETAETGDDVSGGQVPADAATTPESPQTPEAPDPAAAGGKSGKRGVRRVPRAKPRIPEPEGGFSDKNEFGRRGNPLLPTYEEVLRIIDELKAKKNVAFPKSPDVVKAAKGSPRVCMMHYNRIYQERVEAAERTIRDTAREARRDVLKQVARLARDMELLFLMPWSDEGARARLCREMIAELPRLAGCDAPADEEREEEKRRFAVLEQDGRELQGAVDSLLDTADRGELSALLRTYPAASLSRIVCACCWFTPEEDGRRGKLLRGLFEAGDGPDSGLSAEREALARSVARDVCLPPAAVCRDRDRDGIVAFAESLPETAGLFNGRVNQTLKVLLEHRREALLPLAADMFPDLARAGNTAGMALLFERDEDFAREIRDTMYDVDRLVRLADTGQARSLRWILERDRRRPDRATAGEALRRIFAAEAVRRSMNEEAKSALGGCVAALLQHGAELDDDMRARLENGAFPPGETRRIRILDIIPRKLQEAGVAPDAPLIREALWDWEIFGGLYPGGLDEATPAEDVRDFVEKLSKFRENAPKDPHRKL